MRNDIYKSEDEIIDYVTQSDITYKDAISILSDELLSTYNSALLYGYRALFEMRENNNPDVIKYLTKAIEISPQSVFYLNRAVAFVEMQKFPEAISDFDESAKLKPNYAEPYKGKAFVYYFLKDYLKAKESIDIAINIDKNDSAPYRLKGAIALELGDFTLALNSLDQALTIKPDDSLSHNYKGDVFRALKKNKESLFAYEKALELGDKSEDLLRKIDLIKTKLGIAVSEPTKSEEQRPLYFLIKKLKLIKGDLKYEDVKNIGTRLVEILDKIRTHSVVDILNPIAHYTKLKTADILVSSKKEEAKFRYYNVVYMNDPEEGKILMQYLDNENGAIESAFKAGEKGDENNIYLGSFMLAAKAEKNEVGHEDDLVMWRTYGKDENNNEATGCCIVIDPSFFAKSNKYIQSEMLEREGALTLASEPEDAGEPLFRVVYYNKRSKKFEGDNSEKIQIDINVLKETLFELVALKDGDESVNNVIDSIVYRFLSELRYMVKSSDYAVENEYRVIQYFTNENDRVQIEPFGLPRRLYIESAKPILPYFKKVILGPKVPNREQWIYLEAAMKKQGLQMELQYSNCKFQ